MMTDHFTKKELTCRCGCGLSNPTPALLSLAEAVRAVLGKPMIVHCVCRCKEHNKAVGGASKSKHLTGDAMDFHVAGISPEAVRDLIKAAWIRGELPLLGGLGLYQWGVHIDTYKAPDGHLRQWDSR